MKIKKIILCLLTPLIYFTPEQIKTIYEVSVEPTNFSTDRYLGRVYCTFWSAEDGEVKQIKVKTMRGDCRKFMEKLK